MILGAMTFSEVWPIIATVVGVASGICTGALWLSINSIKDSIKTVSDNQAISDNRIMESVKSISDKQSGSGKELGDMKDRIANCRTDCDRNRVSKEDWVRELGYTRQLGERQIATMAKIEAKLDIMQQLPDIAGQIAKSVADKMREVNHG
jgi:hypothetical protein